jgi:hypothetical protein
MHARPFHTSMFSVLLRTAPMPSPSPIPNPTLFCGWLRSPHHGYRHPSPDPEGPEAVVPTQQPSRILPRISLAHSALPAALLCQRHVRAGR